MMDRMGRKRKPSRRKTRKNQSTLQVMPDMYVFHRMKECQRRVSAIM